MLRDVPHCKCILKCGVGALVFAIVMMTWVYPAYCARVMQVKEQKVEEYVEGTYGIHAGTLNSLIDTGQPQLSLGALVGETRLRVGGA